MMDKLKEEFEEKFCLHYQSMTTKSQWLVWKSEDTPENVWQWIEEKLKAERSNGYTEAIHACADCPLLGNTKSAEELSTLIEVNKNKLIELHNVWTPTELNNLYQQSITAAYHLASINLLTTAKNYATNNED